MNFMIQLEKKKTDWLKEHTLTKEQFKKLIAQKVERNKNQSNASKLLA